MVRPKAGKKVICWQCSHGERMYAQAIHIAQVVWVIVAYTIRTPDAGAVQYKRLGVQAELQHCGARRGTQRRRPLRAGRADLDTSSHDLWAVEWRKDIWVNYGDGGAR